MIETGLYTLITSSSDFAALAETRLYPVLLPEESPLPAATYQVVTRRNMYALDAEISFKVMRLEIDTWGETYESSKHLADVIESILSDYTGDLADGSHVFGIQLTGSTDLYESQAQIFRVLTEYAIQYRPAQ